MHVVFLPLFLLGLLPFLRRLDGAVEFAGAFTGVVDERTDDLLRFGAMFVSNRFRSEDSLVVCIYVSFAVIIGVCGMT